MLCGMRYAQLFKAIARMRAIVKKILTMPLSNVSPTRGMKIPTMRSLMRVLMNRIIVRFLSFFSLRLILIRLVMCPLGSKGVWEKY